MAIISSVVKKVEGEKTQSVTAQNTLKSMTIHRDAALQDIHVIGNAS